MASSDEDDARALAREALDTYRMQRGFSLRNAYEARDYAVRVCDGLPLLREFTPDKVRRLKDESRRNGTPLVLPDGIGYVRGTESPNNEMQLYIQSFEDALTKDILRIMEVARNLRRSA